MTIPPLMTHVTIAGILRGGEIWQTGFWTRTGTATTPEGATAHAVRLAALFDNPGGLRAYMVGNLLRGGDSVESLTVAEYPEGGPTAQFIGEFRVHTPGTASGNLPNQVSMVASTRTGQAGRRHRGRMYLPAGGVTLTPTDSEFGTSEITNAASAVATFFSAINTQGGAPPQGPEQVVVLSKVAGTALPVTSVIVDSRPDIQRRRANQQAIVGSFSQPVTQNPV